MQLESYHYSTIKRMWLWFEMRSLNNDTKQIITLISVILFMEKDRLESLLDALPDILRPYLKAHLMQRVFNRIILKLQKYKKNQEIFMQDRDRIFDYLVSNIQLYALVLDIFAGKEKSPNLNIIEQIVRKKFDKNYQLNRANLRLLSYQEKYYRVEEPKNPPAKNK